MTAKRAEKYDTPVMNVIAGITTLTTYRPATGSLTPYGASLAEKRYFTAGEMIFHNAEMQRISK